MNMDDGEQHEVPANEVPGRRQLFEHLQPGSITGVDRLSPALSQVDTKKSRLDALRPLPSEFLTSIEEWYDVELTYSSTAIEGNSLTRSETSLVLEKGLTVNGKPLKDHLEATNHRDALHFVRDIGNRPSRHVSEEDVLEIHRLVLKGIDDDHAGRYRQGPVFIRGTDIVLPAPTEVPGLMQTLARWLEDTADLIVLHPVARAAEAHYRLARIHPFFDGNGRTARLVMNLMLMQAGYPPAAIDPTDRALYLSSLASVDDDGFIDDFTVLMTEAVERSLDRYLLVDQG